MSYICSVCDSVTHDGQQRLTHCVYRTVLDPYTPKGQRQEIAAEYPVCGRCKHKLERGVTFPELLREVVQCT